MSAAYESDNVYKIEFRSNGPAVHEVAIKYGGGGHHNASGTTLTDFKNQFPLLLEDLRKIMQQHVAKK